MLTETLKQEEGFLERADPTHLPKNWWELSCALWRYEYAAAQPELQEGAVVDCACGLGYGTEILHNAGCKVTGLDCSEIAVRTAQLRYPHLTFNLCDLNKEVFVNADSLVTLETLEHLDSPLNTLQQLPHRVKNLIASVPAVPTTQYNPFHKHDFSIESFRKLIEDGGFKIVEVYMQSAPTRLNVYMVIKGVRA
jgi:2-polyprenyl-3-methyl-5-hydroxy-6-metoxy-1,4-benzoquinol methylase